MSVAINQKAPFVNGAFTYNGNQSHTKQIRCVGVNEQELEKRAAVGTQRKLRSDLYNNVFTFCGGFGGVLRRGPSTRKSNLSMTGRFQRQLQSDGYCYTTQKKTIYAGRAGNSVLNS